MVPTADLRASSPETHTRIIYLLLMLLLWVLLLLRTRETALLEADLLWHIKSGEWMWQNGRVPVTDSFSHTFAGKPWIAKEWLSQIFLFTAYALAGWTGVMVLSVAAVGLGVGVLYWFLSRDLSPILAAFCCLIAITLTSPAFTVRPHLLTLGLIILWTYQLFAASREERAPHFGWLLVLVLWANLHAAFTMGFVIAFFAFLDFLERTLLSRRDEAVKWLVFLVLCPAVTLIHPYLWKAMLATLTVVIDNEAVPFISEWNPFNAQTMIIIEIALLTLIFGAMVSGFRLGFAKALLIIVLLHLFLIHVRYLYFLFPILPILLAPELARQFPKLSAAHWQAQPRDPIERASSKYFTRVAGGFVAALLVVLAALVFVIRSAPPEDNTLTKAMDFVKTHNVSGNVFNHYNFGGTLILNGIPTFIDGRTDQLFLGGFVKKFSFGPTAESELSDAFRQYDIRWTLLPPEDQRNKTLDKMPGWKRVYEDKSAVIYQLQQIPAP